MNRGQNSLNKIASLVGKPIRTKRVAKQRDIIEYARVLAEVNMEQIFPNEVHFINEKGLSMT